MYNVSEAFLTALHKKARFERLRGTVGNITFTDYNVVSMSYSNRCSDTADVSLGSCYIGQLEATFVNLLIPRGDWRGKVISLEWGLVLADESVEYIPVGQFTVTEATWSNIGVSVKASDNIAKLDKACDLTNTTGEMYGLMTLAAQECGLTLAQTKAQIEALTNGTEIMGLYPDNDIKTWRDFVAWVAQAGACFAYADREGKLALKSWAALSAVDSLTESEREYQTTFSDYTTRYDGISVVNIDDQTTTYYSNGQGGAVINLGSNPFLQYGTDETRARMRQAIADGIANVEYTPFNSGVLSNMAYDLGDILTCSGGVAGSETLSCCVMAIDWTSKNLTTFQGFGADPSLTSGKSKTDKVLDGMIKKTTENEVVIHTFENADDFVLDDDDLVDILTIRFATINPKIVNLWHEIELYVEADPLGDGVVTCQAFYYLDDEPIAYSPITTWDNDGFHLLHLLYFLRNLEGNSAHKWEVKLKVNGGTATIDVGDIHASLYGQGLAAVGTWGGLIEVSDEYSGILSGGAEFGYTDAGITFDWRQNQVINITENYDFSGIGGAVFSYTDEADAHTQNIIYELVDADHTVNIGSSDGLFYIQSST